MADLSRARSTLDHIWPEYHPSSRNFAVYREGRDALLLTASPPVHGFQTVEHRRLRGKAWYATGDLASLTGGFVLNSDLGGVTATAVRDDLGLLTLIHEDFHSFQSEMWGAGIHPRLNAFNHSNADQLALGFELETEVLLRAWSSDGEAQRAYLFDYLALRSAREKRMTQRQRASERHLELTEGAATYVELKSAAILGLSTDQRLRSLRRLLLDSQDEHIQMMVRHRSYAVGSILCLMLDEWSQKDDWKSNMSSAGASLSLSLKEALDLDPAALEARGERLLAQKGFGRRLEQKQRDGSRASGFVDLSAYRWQLLFTFTSDKDGLQGKNPGNVSFRSGGIFHLADEWTLVPEPTDYSFSLYGNRLRVSQHPVVSRQIEREGQAVIEVAVLLKQPPSVGDGQLDPGTHLLVGQPFREVGVSLNAAEAVRVELRALKSIETGEYPWMQLTQ